MSDASFVARERVLALLESYEDLLTEKQRNTVNAYYRYDLSLSEIAEEESISRAGVNDALKKTVEKLEEFESHLGLVALKERIGTKKASLDETKAPAEEYSALLEEVIHGI